MALARRADVDVVVEVMGGEDGPAKATRRGRARARQARRHRQQGAARPCTARRWPRPAEARGVALRFEAAVAGGIPIIKALSEGLAGNRVTRVMGVMNGTCNYILTRMRETRALPYDDVLAEAQRLGYAEADPSFDVDGIDAGAQARAAGRARLRHPGRLRRRADRGHRQRQPRRTSELADDLGYRIKLLGVARMTRPRARAAHEALPGAADRAARPAARA